MHIALDTAVAVIDGTVGFAVLFVLVTALLGIVFGIGIERIQVGAPFSFRVFQIGQTEFRFSPIALTSFVKFAKPEEAEHFAPWPQRALLAIAAPVAGIAICAIPLGARAVDEALMAWPQLWSAVIDASSPADFDNALQPWLQSEGYPAAIAIVVIKMAMINLLPLPFTGGGAFLFALVRGLTGKEISERALNMLLPWTLVPTLAVLLFVLLRGIGVF